MPSKYPCGSCSIGVKFSGIKCTGPCNLWHHAGCQNISEKLLKKWSDKEINSWKCNNCKINHEFSIQAIPNSSVSPELLCNSINELESSLSENNFLQNLEDDHEKLKMAGEIGAKLLEENKFLKEKIT
ncbi:hypothetical protein J6590_003605 [Homalodisca vitripennis]|nr:hypothetical protein J6590_003605 [Homalodisca vitripennis]